VCRVAVEITHGRVAMLAALGFLVGEQVEGSSFLFDAEVTVGVLSLLTFLLLDLNNSHQRQSIHNHTLHYYRTRVLPEEPLSFLAIKDLAISHCAVGRKSRGRLLAVGHYASWHPKKTIIRVQS
jgi:hypothetical protein